MFHEPKVAVEEASRVECPGCGETDVYSCSVTSMTVHMRCRVCGHDWTIAERRRLPRAEDAHKRY